MDRLDRSCCRCEGNYVVVGARSIVFPGVKIGDHAVIGANSVVVCGSIIGDGEPWSGNPAKPLTWYSDNETKPPAISSDKEC